MSANLRLTGADLVRKLGAGGALGASAAGLVLLVGWLGWLDTPELKTYDWRMRWRANPAAVSRDIVLVEINDTSIRDLEPVFGRWPWPRVVMSSLLDFLARAPARVIAVDLAFTERDRVSYDIDGVDWKGAESDAALVDGVRNASNVLLLATAVYEGVTGGEQANTPATWRSLPYRLGPAIEERRLVIPPFQELTDAAAGLGHNFIALDQDGPARRMVPFIRVGERYLPFLGVAAALRAGGFTPDEVALEPDGIRIRDRVLPFTPITVANVDDRSKTHTQLTALINYLAKPLHEGARPYTSYEARYLLRAENQILAGEKPDVDPSLFKDKIVFVGLTASGLLDIFPTPFEQHMPGIQLHASIADSILTNRFMRPATRWSQVVSTLALALVAGVLSTTLPMAAAGVGTLLVIGGWNWFAMDVFERGVWTWMVQPTFALALALFAGTTYRYFVEDQEKRKVKRLFGRYVSKDVFHQLLQDPARAELGGARREMSVLFSDIRGFTSVTEKGDPEALVAQLNEYFSRMVDVVFKHRGTVDKFVGDMVMALFGAPLDDVDHAENAVKAAVEMVVELGALNRKWAAEGRTQLDIGIGVNSGDMIAGNIGSSSIMSYTVIGDNVNLGSRLESLNKDYRTRIIISDATRVRLKGNYTVRPLGDVVVKGKTRPVSIYELAVRSPVFSDEAPPEADEALPR